MNIGERIFNLRKENSLSQEQLALMINVSRQSISRWELGESNPELCNIIQLSKIFNVTTDFILTGEMIEEVQNFNDTNNLNKIIKYKMSVIIALVLLILSIPLYLMREFNLYLGIILPLFTIAGSIIVYSLTKAFYMDENELNYNTYKKYSLLYSLLIFYVVFGLLELFFNESSLNGISINFGSVFLFLSSILIMKKYNYKFKGTLIIFVIVSIVIFFLIYGPYFFDIYGNNTYFATIIVRLIAHYLVGLIYIISLILKK